jgi:hypothetical protein
MPTILSDSFINQVVGEKVALALKAGVQVIACVGETQDERKGNKTLEVVTRQLEAISSAFLSLVSVSLCVFHFPPFRERVGLVQGRYRL